MGDKDNGFCNSRLSMVLPMIYPPHLLTFSSKVKKNRTNRSGGCFNFHSFNKMAGFWKYIQSLFQHAEQSSPARPFIHELIERSADHKQALDHWKHTMVCHRLLGWVVTQYQLYLTKPDETDESIDFLHTPSSKGFVIHLDKTNYTLRESSFLLDLLKERVIQEGYRVQVSDRRIYQKSKWVETAERHYLKPKPEFSSPGIIRQRYGNITILLLLRNDQPFQLQFQSTAYRDHLFQEAEGFGNLMLHLLK
jgi:hypothetical protein